MFAKDGRCHSGGSARGATRGAGGECQEDKDETAEKDKTQVGQKEYYRFWKKLPEAPKAVQEQMQKIKDQPHRSGKQKQLAEMAKAYACQKWDHKLFKPIESLQQERSKAREDIVMPKVIMVAKCGGKAPFEQATCLVNFTMSYNDYFVFLHVSFQCRCLGIGGRGDRRSGKPRQQRWTKFVSVRDVQGH